MKRKDQKQLKNIASQKTEFHQQKENVRQKTTLGKKRIRFNKPIWK